MDVALRRGIDQGRTMMAGQYFFYAWAQENR
jgi:hypothetical protein